MEVWGLIPATSDRLGLFHSLGGDVLVGDLSLAAAPAAIFLLFLCITTAAQANFPRIKKQLLGSVGDCAPLDSGTGQGTS